MKIQQYFGLLLLSSIICFLFLAIHSRLLETAMFQRPHKIIQRYTKQFLSPNTDVPLSPDSGINKAKDNFQDIQELVQKLLSKNQSTTKNSHTETTSNNKDDDKRCEPAENIVFLKTHKTGSSTLTNIFNRFADLRELRVALPLPGFNRFRWPMAFHWTSVNLFLLGTNYANILCNHARYNRDAMDSIMEIDSKYVTILRNPVQQFESTFDYMEFSSFFGLGNTTDPIRRFLRRPFDHIRNLTSKQREPLSDSLHLLRNGMFFDLGLNHNTYNNRTLILNAIKNLDKEFFLVLIMEYFDESLVLLKRELCWELEDIVYVKFNQRHREKREKIDESLKRMIERWNGADVLLYRHFNQTFWMKIKKHGKAFYEDLEEFRLKNLQVQRDCISPVVTKEKAVGLTKDVRKLQLNPLVSNFDRYFCSKILMDEIEYLKYYRMKFNPYFGYQKQIRFERSRQVQDTMAPFLEQQQQQPPSSPPPPQQQQPAQQQQQQQQQQMHNSPRPSQRFPKTRQFPIQLQHNRKRLPSYPQFMHIPQGNNYIVNNDNNKQ